MLVLCRGGDRLSIRLCDADMQGIPSSEKEVDGPAIFSGLAATVLVQSD